MGFRERIVEQLGPRLAPGECIQAAFAGQPRIRMGFFDRYLVVAVTDRRIVAFRSGTFSQTRVGDVVGEFPRATRCGPTSGIWHEVALPGLSFLVNRRYFADLAAADAALPGSPAS